MSPRHPSRLVQIAYHEAAHAVAACIQRRRIRSVTIIPESDQLGATRLAQWPKDLKSCALRGARRRAWIEREIRISFAGRIAEEILTGRPVSRGTDQDWSKALEFAFYVTKPYEETLAYLNWLRIDTKQLLRFPPHWYATQVLAAELLAHGRVGGRRARQVIANAVSDYVKAQAQGLTLPA